MKFPTTDIFPNLQGGTRQRGGDWTTSNTVDRNIQKLYILNLNENIQYLMKQFIKWFTLSIKNNDFQSKKFKFNTKLHYQKVA